MSSLHNVRLENPSTLFFVVVVIELWEFILYIGKSPFMRFMSSKSFLPGGRLPLYLVGDFHGWAGAF